MNYRVDKISMSVYLMVLAIALVWTGGTIAAPVAEAHWGIAVHHLRSFDASLPGIPGFIELLIRSSYGRICHQIPDRCYWIAGHPMAVCARC
ncbi:MAG TPA: DUF2085 domain-containing protein, partial [Blastocatellia bacterium]|nr:DUF2085 domain-containing protein [Blastocatellia bacterium]